MTACPRAQFLAAAENTGIPSERSFYAVRPCRISASSCSTPTFDADGAPYDHGNFAWDDCNVPAAEIAWLRTSSPLRPEPAIVFIHQQLDGEGDSYYVKNAAEVRAILEQSRTRSWPSSRATATRARSAGSAGIPYYTLIGMIEGSGPRTTLMPSSTSIREATSRSGFRRAASRGMPKGP